MPAGLQAYLTLHCNCVDPLPDVGVNPGPTPFVGVQPCILAEVPGAMFKMRRARGANGDGLVVELFKHGLPCLHACLGVIIWRALKTVFYAQETLIHFGDTRCSRWFRRLRICNKLKFGDQ